MQQGRQFEQNAAQRGARDWSRAAGEERGGEDENRGFSRSRDFGNGNGQMMNIADIAIRGTARLLDIEFATLRTFWQIQARSAAAFGAPDCSEMIRRAESSVQRLLSTSTEQMLTSVHQAAQAFTEIQNQVGQVIEDSAEQVTEEIRQGMEEFGERSREGMSAMRDTAESATSSYQRNTGRGSSQGQQRHQQSEGQGGEHQQAQGETPSESDQGSGEERPKAGAQNKNAERNSRAGKHH